MSFRFRKSIKILPGVKVNIGKHSIGMSVGVKGAHVGFNSRGTYTDASIPGTGISSFQYIGKTQAQVVQTTSKPKRHILLKLLFFPLWLVWLELKVIYWFFKMVFKIVSYLYSKWYARQASIVDTQTQFTADTRVEAQQQEDIKECTGQLMAGTPEDKLEAHQKQMLAYSVRNYNGYVTSEVVKGKVWSIGNENDKHLADVCEVCKANANAGEIPLHARFPSGHLYPPAGKLCRCWLLPVVAD